VAAGLIRTLGRPNPAFILAVAVWLWFTVLFANFAEAMAEGRSKAQAASLRSLKKSTWAKKLAEPRHGTPWLPEQAENLRKGDVVLVEAGDVSRWTARSSKAWPRSTRAPSPANRPPWCANRAETSRP
jgi:high-affinity K+ transport system ATPase subunit B